MHQICRTLSLPTWGTLRLGGQRFLHVVDITGNYYNFFLQVIIIIIIISVLKYLFFQLLI